MKKTLIIISLLLAAAAAWVLLLPGKNPFKKWVNKTPGESQEQNNQAIDTGYTGTGGSFFPKVPEPDTMPGFPLSQGSRGSHVRALQTALNSRFGSVLVPDGIFGPKTYKAISANGFNADSISYKQYLEILG